MQTPYFQYDLNLLKRTLETVQEEITDTNFMVHYAIKANHNEKILRMISNYGFGADCVSGGEVKIALENGFSPKDIVFAGVGKTDEEIEFAIHNQIGVLHCESLEEAKVINEIAKDLNKIVKVAIRLNPNVNAKTHEKITTGLKENKFGFSNKELETLKLIKNELNHIQIIGLHFHIGSQITDLSVYEELCERIHTFIPFFRKEIGEMTYLNVGGGLGINYQNPDEEPIADFETYFSVFKNGLKDYDFPVHFELGRSIVGQIGNIITKVLYVKDADTKKIAIIDAGMTELLRPALYNSFHKIEFLGISFIDQNELYDVVGPVCESSDTFGENFSLPSIQRGDLLTIRSCGAYAESMSLQYNGRRNAESIYINNSMYSVENNIKIAI